MQRKKDNNERKERKKGKKAIQTDRKQERMTHRLKISNSKTQTSTLDIQIISLMPCELNYQRI